MGGWGRKQGQDLRKPASITVEVVTDFPAKVSADSYRGQTAKRNMAFDLPRTPEKAQVTGRTWACRAKRLASPNPPTGYRSHSLAPERERVLLNPSTNIH